MSGLNFCSLAQVSVTVKCTAVLLLLLGGDLPLERCRTDDLLPSIPISCLPPCHIPIWTHSYGAEHPHQLFSARWFVDGQWVSSSLLMVLVQQRWHGGCWGRARRVSKEPHGHAEIDYTHFREVLTATFVLTSWSDQGSRIRAYSHIFWKILSYANVFHFSVRKQEQNTYPTQTMIAETAVVICYFGNQFTRTVIFCSAVGICKAALK